jgi:hypothetical protein
LAQKFEAFALNVTVPLNTVLSLVKVHTHKITPSQACMSTNSGDFVDLMSSLRLPSTLNLTEICEDGPIFSDEFPTLNFLWGDQKENTSYSFVKAYVEEKIQKRSEIVSNGQNLPNGLLFDVDVYSIRPKLRDSADIRLMYRLSGSSDIIVLQDIRPQLSRTFVEYAIEIKTEREMSTDAGVKKALREGCLQLIGLNAYNTLKSPAVIVTNLVSSNYVMYLTLDKDPETY